MRKKFDESDRTLIFLYNFLRITSLILIFAVIVVSVILWIKSAEKGSPIEWWVGFCVLIPGALLTYLFYESGLVVVWVLYDIKTIRTAVCKTAPSQNIDKFGEDIIERRSKGFPF